MLTYILKLTFRFDWSDEEAGIFPWVQMIPREAIKNVLTYFN